MSPLTRFSRMAAWETCRGWQLGRERPKGDSGALFQKRLHPGDSQLVSVNIEDSVLKSGSEKSDTEFEAILEMSQSISLLVSFPSIYNQLT